MPSEISAGIPQGCDVTFAQVLSRHGARDPTASKTAAYNDTIQRIHRAVTDYSEEYSFIKDYAYALGADQLTQFGQQEMVHSGIRFYQRYGPLVRTISPFVRSAGQPRVVESARHWSRGFHQARLDDGSSKSPDGYPYDVLVIPEDDTVNNTLSHGRCTSFETGPLDQVGDAAQEQFSRVFVPAITERVNRNLAGANLSDTETIYMMDLCPFNTVADGQGQLSPFCRLFSPEEWQAYGYLQSLGKWYGYGNGNPLGPTQGVGFVNELIARLSGKPVDDDTTTNSTLDSPKTTFPLDSRLYADFSHDNDMAGVYGALGLYNTTAPLSNTTRQTTDETQGYSASWTVPFAARMYVEKMACGSSEEELVRILVNDRVVPLQNCGADDLGRCKLSRFVDSLSFARSGGHWDACAAPSSP